MITAKKINLYCCGCCLLVCCLVTADTYFSGSYTIPEVCASKSAPFSSGGVGRRGWTSYLLDAASGKEYNVPKFAYNQIVEGESFTIRKTRLFRKSTDIEFVETGYFYSFPIGALKGNFMGVFVICFVSAGALLIGTLILAFKKKYRNKTQFSLCICNTGADLFLFY